MLKQSYLFQEIHAQPKTLQTLLAEERSAIEACAAAINQRGIHHLVIAARGTSDNAARYAQYVFGAHNRLLVTLATPSLFSLYQQPPDLRDTCVIGISQSGKSPDILAVLAEARSQGALTVAITNTPTSPLAQDADCVIDLRAGVEKSVAATKSYTAQLAAIAALSASLAEDNSLWSQLEQVPQLVTETLSQTPEIAQFTERYRYMQHCVVIGRGFNYATAFELALKLKELTYSIVEPYSSADFLHGPVALINHGFPVIVIAPQGILLNELQGFIQIIKDRGAETVIISNDHPTLKLAQTPLALPTNVPEWLSPLVAIVPGQLFALHLAYARGHSLDAPRGLQKVTETH